LYDIRPGNGAGLFLQPRSPHRATTAKTALCRALRGNENKEWREVFTQRTDQTERCQQTVCMYFSVAADCWVYHHLTAVDHWLRLHHPPPSTQHLVIIPCTASLINSIFNLASVSPAYFPIHSHHGSGQVLQWWSQENLWRSL